jgi:hypothetical protein
MNLENWLKVAETGAVIIASGTAIYGINSWRRELKGKKRYELAEETLSLFYKAKDIIHAIRSPFGSADEGKSRPPVPGENAGQKKARDQAYVLWERYFKHEETFNNIRALRYKFMAIFGSGAVKPFDYLSAIIHKFSYAVIVLSDALYQQSETHVPRTEAETEKIQNTIREFHAVFWEGVGKPDPINDDVNLMIAEIEKICTPVLSKK